MPTESDFLRLIAGRPDDRLLRLVYADWLDDTAGHLDPAGRRMAARRAEAIRLEEAARAAPVFADEYWAVRPRRAEPPDRLDVGWRAALGYDGPYHLLLAHGLPDGWRDRWRLVRAAADQWTGTVLPDVGGRPPAVDAAEAELGHELPAAAREWLAFAADLPDLTAPRYLGLSSGFVPAVGRLPGVDGFSIARYDPDGGPQFQCVLAADAGQDDPPLTCYGVYTSEGVADPEPVVQVNPDWCHDRLTSFALAEVLARVSGQATFFGHVPAAAAPAFVDRLRAECPAHARLAGQELFEAPELLVTVYPSRYPEPGVGVSAKARRPCPAALRRLPAGFRDWLAAAAEREGGPQPGTAWSPGMFLAHFDEPDGRPPAVVLVDE